MSGKGIMHGRDRVYIESGALEVKVHSDSWNISNMVIVLMGDENRLKFLLRRKRQAGGKTTGIYRQDFINQ
jgi:hypothetical protein